MPRRVALRVVDLILEISSDDSDERGVDSVVLVEVLHQAEEQPLQVLLAEVEQEQEDNHSNT